MGEQRLNKRIPVDDEVQRILRDFAYGGGTTYNAAIKFLLDSVREPGESYLSAGLRLRDAIARHEKDKVERAS